MNWQRHAEHRDQITSKAGGWTIGGETILYGYNIHQQLGRHVSWMQTVLLATTGRLVSEAVAKFFEKGFIMTGYPDPRLWCNRVSALAGDAQCPPSASYAAAIASAEARIYGRQADYKAACLLHQAKKIHDSEGETGLEEFIRQQLKEKRVIYGFGRPLLNADERIVPFAEEAAKLGLVEGEYLAVAFKIEQYLKRYKMIINYGGYMMARLLDMGFTPKEISRLLALTFYTGIVPCYIEAFENEPGTFLPIACEDIAYEGVAERPIPE